MDDFLNSFEKVKEKMSIKTTLHHKETDNPKFGGGAGSSGGITDRDLNVGNRKSKPGFDEFKLGNKTHIKYNFLDVKGKGTHTKPDPFGFNNRRDREPPSRPGRSFVHSIKKYPLIQLLNTNFTLILKNLLRHIIGVISERPLIESENS